MATIYQTDIQSSPQLRTVDGTTAGQLSQLRMTSTTNLDTPSSYEQSRRQISSVVVAEEILGPIPDQNKITYVEVPVVKEVVKYVPKTSIVEVEKFVPKYEIKHVEEIVEVPQIAYIDRPIEKIIEHEVGVPIIHETIREVIKQVPKIEYRQTEKIVEIPGDVIEVPVIHRDGTDDKAQDKEIPVVVAQTIRPVLSEKYDRSQEVDMYQYNPQTVPVDVLVAKPVPSKLLPIGAVSEKHLQVEIPAPQYNTILREINDHLPAEEIGNLPYIPDPQTQAITFLHPTHTPGVVEHPQLKYSQVLDKQTLPEEESLQHDKFEQTQFTTYKETHQSPQLTYIQQPQYLQEPQYTEQQIQYTDQQVQYTEQPQQYTKQQSQYTHQQSQYTHQQSQYAKQQSQYAKQQSQYAKQQSQYTQVQYAQQPQETQPVQYGQRKTSQYTQEGQPIYYTQQRKLSQYAQEAQPITTYTQQRKVSQQYVQETQPIQYGQRKTSHYTQETLPVQYTQTQYVQAPQYTQASQYTQQKQHNGTNVISSPLKSYTKYMPTDIITTTTTNTQHLTYKHEQRQKSSTQYDQPQQYYSPQQSARQTSISPDYKTIKTTTVQSSTQPLPQEYTSTLQSPQQIHIAAKYRQVSSTNKFPEQFATESYSTYNATKETDMNLSTGKQQSEFATEDVEHMNLPNISELPMELGVGSTTTKRKTTSTAKKYGCAC